jgi:hypothetical protein
MALATYTASVFNNQPKYTQIGNVSVSGKVQWTAAGSVGDVLFCAKVPHGAKIVDFCEYHTNGETAAAIKWGFNKGIAAGGAGNSSCLIAAGAVATMNRMSYAASPTNGPVTISLSDADPVRYAVLTGKAASGTFTISVVAAFCLTYRMDGPEVQ